MTDEAPRSTVLWSAQLGLLAVSLAGCGFGTAGLAGLANSSGGNGNATPTLTISGVQGLGTTSPKVAPAQIRLVAVDAESDPAVVEFFYAIPSAPAVEIPLIGLAENPVTLATSEAGIAHTLSWDFPAEAQLPSSASFVDGVRLIALARGGARQEAIVGMGNDPPVTEAIDPGAEVNGIAALRFRLSDSSDDVVDVKVEYRVEGVTGAVWQTARPGGLDPGLTTPEFAVSGVQAPRTGVELVFFWDTNADLPDLERDVRVRFTARDEVATGVPAESSTFRVDNNDEPFARIDAGSFFANPDEQLGIPLPYSVIDEEGDPVRVVFQWRSESSAGFVPLGTTDPNELATKLDDPAFIRAKQICTPYPGFARGHAFAVDATHVRLPELVRGESPVLASSVEFRELHLLRPHSAPARLAATWTRPSPLTEPWAAVSLGDGLTALVLERAAGGGSGSTRLLEVSLATGALVREVAAGLAGVPTALACEAGSASALVATDLGGGWQLHRVDLESETVTTVLTGPAGGPTSRLRSIAPLGANVALATAENALWRLDWSNTASPRATVVVDGLATPWGLALDQLRPGRVWVAERDAAVTGGTGRVVSVSLDTLEINPVVATAAVVGDPAFPGVTALALQDGGGRLVALCQPSGSSGRELLAVNLGRTGNAVFSLGVVEADASSVATGPVNLLLVALPMSVDLAAGGGVEQTRTLVSFDRATTTATVTTAFEPGVRDLQPWRIRTRDPFREPLRGSVAGTQGVFVWDCGDVRASQRVFVQAICMDEEFGATAGTTLPRQVGGMFDDPAVLATGATLLTALSVVAADLDNDGDMDLAVTNLGSNGVTVLLQDAPGQFTAQPPQSTVGADPRSIVAADLDGDGAMDLVTANALSNDLTVLLQLKPGQFTAQPALPTGGVRPESVVAADLDGDGDMDLATANAGSADLTVFFQDAPQEFTAQVPVSTGGVDPGSVAAADFDGDGDLDLATANSGSNDVTLFFQDVPRQFTAQTPVPTGGLGAGSIVAADLDEDGDEDLVTANAGSDDVTVLLQAAPRQFTAQPPVPTGGKLTAQAPAPTGGSNRSVVATDLDGDGDLDLVTANAGSDNVTVLLHEPSGQFTAQSPMPSGGSSPGAVSAADLNGDGGQELLVANFGQGLLATSNLTALYQTAPRQFTAQPPIPTARALFRALVSADLDGDGDLDLVTTADDSDDLTVLFQDVPRQFTAQPPVPTGGSCPRSVAAADLDGDGDLDLVTANSSSDDLTVFFQDAPRQFSAQPPIPTGGSVLGSVIAADLDNDGDLDLVTTGSASDDVTVLFQDVARQFTAQEPMPTIGSSPSSVVAADLDGDGDLDLATANIGSNSVTLFFQDAPRQFTVRPPVSTFGSVPTAIVATDLNGDGELDLVVSNANSNNLSLFFRTAPQQFTAQFLLGPIPSRPQSLTAADLDGNGTVDLVTANAVSNDVTVLFQDAPLQFTTLPPIPTGGLRPDAVAAADLDGDGDLDLVTANNASVTVYWSGR